MKKLNVFLITFLLLSSSSWCIKIDGKIWDWESIGKEFQCRSRILSKDRSGLEMKTVKMYLGKKYLYVLVKGKSVTGQKADKGEGFKRTSVRLSFSSAQSPLNRARILAHPGDPWRIKVSAPYARSLKLGNKTDKYWCFGKHNGSYYVEMKVPIFEDTKGVHVVSTRGPLIKLSAKDAGTRNRLSDLLINTVDTRTHRLVDTASFQIKKDDL